ncbi:putative metal-binding protein [Microbacterium halimionae]|nr:putative metal-binding protein [Microbacterium halimionae]
MLPVRCVFSCERDCRVAATSVLALALLVARVRLADNHDAAVTTDHFAVIADGPNGGLNLHDVPIRCLRAAW